MWLCCFSVAVSVAVTCGRAYNAGMEDFGLLKVLSDPAKAAALAAKVLKSDGTGVNITAGSPAAFELVRREAAAEAEAEATAAVNKHRPF